MNDVTIDVMSGVAFPSFKLVKVPRLVMLGCAAESNVPTNAVDEIDVKLLAVVPDIVAFPVVMKPPPLKLLEVILILKLLAER